MGTLSFILGATDHGPMILSRQDYQLVNGGGYGVGYQLLETGTFDQDEVQLILSLLPKKHGAIVLDIGANIGALTLPIAKHLAGWGFVFAFEPQERIYYALAGNIALNNCFNARAMHVAVSDKTGTIMVPLIDYQRPASYGSLGIKDESGDVGQKPIGSYPVTAICIDAMNLPNLEFMKIDVEGMELDVLNGAEKTIAKYRPTILAEHIKCGYDKLKAWLTGHGYSVTDHGINLLACCLIAGK